MTLDLSAITALPVFRSATLSPEKVWTLQGGTCAVGAVMLIRCGAKIALVTKAERHNYAFSDRLAMPGGLIRAVQGEDLNAAFSRSLFERVTRESGINVDTLRDVRVHGTQSLPVSGYIARERERRTVIIAVEAVADIAMPLNSTDPSVKSAGWYDLPPPWESIAPANRLIIAAVLAQHLTFEERASARATVDEAHVDCSRWAADVRLPAASHPFDRHNAVR